MGRKYLYSIAAALWGIPGVIIAAFVLVSFFLMFRKIVDQYSARIAAQPQTTTFWQTFPLRGWILIVCMSCLGPMLIVAACRFLSNQKRI